MAKRYELPGTAWDLVADIFTQTLRTGRPRVDYRLMLSGGLWVLCSGSSRARYARALWPLVNGVSTVSRLA